MKYILLLSFIYFSNICLAVESQCFGTTSNGYIENSKQLPIKGDNFIIYNKLGDLLGRNFVHSKVYNVVIETYAKLFKNHNHIKYMYGETGWKHGGSFKPHKTHQNGLSVDFMVPVVNKQGKSSFLSNDFTNKFGYGIEFDQNGKYQNYTIDFEAIALHLVQLHKDSTIQNIKIRRVIFAPEYRKLLFKTSHSNYIKKHIQFMKNKAWVRHDEHYHVDFKIKCEN